jgi:hypothetical protein
METQKINASKPYESQLGSTLLAATIKLAVLERPPRF